MAEMLRAYPLQSGAESAERKAERERIAAGTKRVGDTLKPAETVKSAPPTFHVFTSNLTPMARAKANAALETQVRYNGKEFLTRAALIERKISQGAWVEKSKNGQRVLVSKDGAFLDQRNITKTGLDYAEHLQEAGNANPSTRSAK